MKRPSPRLDNRTAAFYTERHQSLNSAAEFWLAAVPSLSHWSLGEIRGRFSEEELETILDSVRGINPEPMIINQQIALYVRNLLARTGDASDLPERIDALTHFQRACLAVWAFGFWQGTRESAGNGPGSADMVEWCRPLLADDDGKGGTK